MSQSKEYPPITIRLVNTTETRWILEGTENSSNPISMNFPSLYRIIPESQVMIAETVKKDPKTNEVLTGYRLKTTRHIANCESIDPVKQKDSGYEPNPQLDTIWIENGTGTFKREGNMVGTYDFIKSYQGNVSNPLRPPEAEAEFEEVVAVDIARKENEDFDKELEAMNLIAGLRNKNRKGEYEYDEPNLDKLVAIFDVTDLDSAEEKFNALYKLAKAQPDRIINSVADERKEIVALVKQSDDLGLIIFEKERISLAEDNSVIIAFDEDHPRATQVNKLVEYLCSAEGRTWLDQLYIKRSAKISGGLKPR
jgi:hypothetical protein